MQSTQCQDLLGRVGAIISDSHIVYTSGKHGSSYVNKDAIYPHTELTSRLCSEIAVYFRGHGVDVVVAPVIGGVILSQWVAFHLTQLGQTEVQGVYAEKSEAEPGSFVLRRGYDQIVKGKRVLVVEDILNTGGSVKKVIEVVRKEGGQLVGVAALCNRGGVTPEQLGDVPELYSLMNLSLEAWDSAECPLCAKNIPINTQVGKGKRDRST
jgi:orotate phosphoribosyltransferase